MRAIASLACAAALAGAATLPAPGSGNQAGSSGARFTPPSSSVIDVPLHEAIGPAAARRAPSPRQVRRKDGAGKRRHLFPETRVAAVYGAPQLTATIVGKRSPRGSAKEALRLTARYAKVDPRPAQPAIDLIAVVANADPGPGGLYRTRQSPELIATYLDAARKVGGRLVLDVQPGRSRFVREVKALDQWIAEPDVDIALDPEWNVGKRGIPGVTEGSVTAKQLNKVSAHLVDVVADNGLPQKALYIHQFREDSVRGRDDVLQRGANVAVALNFDGIGSPGPKIAGYRALAEPGLFNGFSVFVSRDVDVMGFRRIAALEPPPDYVMYQ